jgi:hypothetical protein
MRRRTVTIRISLSKVLALFVGAAVAIGAMVVVERGVSGAAAPRSAEAQINPLRANAAPYRDGFFVGHMQCSEGKEPEISLGRWGIDPDKRWLFMQGYEAGYQCSARSVALLP